MLTVPHELNDDIYPYREYYNRLRNVIWTNYPGFGKEVARVHLALDFAIVRLHRMRELDGVDYRRLYKEQVRNTKDLLRAFGLLKFKLAPGTRPHKANNGWFWRCPAPTQKDPVLENIFKAVMVDHGRCRTPKWQEGARTFAPALVERCKQLLERLVKSLTALRDPWGFSKDETGYALRRIEERIFLSDLDELALCLCGQHCYLKVKKTHWLYRKES